MKKQIKSKNKNLCTEDVVIKFKRRMLEWSNPIEYVNNMYGCHPRDGNIDYFKKIFKNENR